MSRDACSSTALWDPARCTVLYGGLDLEEATIAVIESGSRSIGWKLKMWSWLRVGLSDGYPSSRRFKVVSLV